MAIAVDDFAWEEEIQDGRSDIATFAGKSVTVNVAFHDQNSSGWAVLSQIDKPDSLEQLECGDWANAWPSTNCYAPVYCDVDSGESVCRNTLRQSPLVVPPSSPPPLRD